VATWGLENRPQRPLPYPPLQPLRELAIAALTDFLNNHKEQEQSQSPKKAG